MEEFNFCVAYYWKDNSGAIGTYTYGGEVHNGTLEYATEFMEYVKRQSPDKEWKIFKVVELAEVDRMEQQLKDVKRSSYVDGYQVGSDLNRDYI